MNQLIRCINCGEVFLKTSFDQWPEYESDPRSFPEPLRVIKRDDFKDFLKNHRGHRLEDLSILEDSFISEKPYIEPVKTSYFRVTNGKEQFVVKKFREDIHEPLRYQLISGDYSLKLLGLEVQSGEILKQWKAEFKNNSLLFNKGEVFLNIYQNILKTLRVDQMERVSEESSHPLEVYYRLDEVSLAYLLRNCRNRFKGKEYSEIESFIDHHKEDGVLLLKATYRIQINERVKIKEKATPASLPLEKREVSVKKRS